MPLFAEQPDRPRIAAFVDYEFPAAQHQHVYERLQRLAETLDADLRVVHTVCADPAEVAPGQKHLLGGGLFVPQDPQIRANDVEHVRSTLAQRFDPLVATLRSAVGCSTAAIINRPEMQTACSATRWLRGWTPDLIASFGLEESALHALVAAELLDVPRLTMLDATAGDTAFALLLPMHIAQSEAIWAGNQQTEQELLARFGDSVPAKLCPHAAGDSNRLQDQSATVRIPTALAARLQTGRTAQQPRLGPGAAFRTTNEPRAASACERGLLVLGSERTGSNLLVGMLDQHPQIATANEVFNPRLIRANVMPWLTGSDADPEGLMRMRLANPAGLHLRLLDEGTHQGSNRIGFKLLYYHALIDDRLSDHLWAQTGMPIVHLLRRDRLARFASLCRAYHSDEWYANSGAPSPMPGSAKHAPLQLDARAMVTEFTMCELFEDRFRALLREHNHLELDYQELCDDLPSCTQRLSDHLGVALGTLTPRTRKTGHSDVRNSIRNMDDVDSWLRCTRWAHLAHTDAP